MGSRKYKHLVAELWGMKQNTTGRLAVLWVRSGPVVHWSRICAEYPAPSLLPRSFTNSFTASSWITNRSSLNSAFSNHACHLPHSVDWSFRSLLDYIFRQNEQSLEKVSLLRLATRDHLQMAPLTTTTISSRFCWLWAVEFVMLIICCLLLSRASSLRETNGGPQPSVVGDIRKQKHILEPHVKRCEFGCHKNDTDCFIASI